MCYAIHLYHSVDSAADATAIAASHSPASAQIRTCCRKPWQDSAGSSGVPCQQKPYGGCGGTHTKESTCCIASGTTGYDVSSGDRVQTSSWSCRFWKGRAYSQCLPTGDGRAAPIAVSPKLAEGAKKLAKGKGSDQSSAAPIPGCQTKTYSRCEKETGCCVAPGTKGYVDGKKTTSWACKSWKGHPYSQCLPDV